MPRFTKKVHSLKNKTKHTKGIQYLLLCYDLRKCFLNEHFQWGPLNRAFCVSLNYSHYSVPLWFDGCFFSKTHQQCMAISLPAIRSGGLTKAAWLGAAGAARSARAGSKASGAARRSRGCSWPPTVTRRAGDANTLEGFSGGAGTAC